MATIPASVKAQLDADWTGAGGVEPTYYLEEEDFRVMPPLGEDSVWIMSKSLDTDASDVVNDLFVNEKHVLTLIVNTTTDADRLKELSDEVVRILNATRVADITYQRLRKRNREMTENQGIWVFQEVIVYDLQEQMKDSAAAYGAGAGPSLTQDNIEDLLMWESANAAWVVCPLEDAYITAYWRLTTTGTLTNIGASDPWAFFSVPLPTNKGGLKLYISGTTIGLSKADANDYVTSRYVRGYRGAVALDTNLDNLTTADDHEDTFTGVDCSSYKAIKIQVTIFATNALGFELDYVLAKCYYDT